MYGWKKGTQFKINAKAAAAVLEHVREKNNGRLTPEVVLDEARHEDSPLHPEFEWDDSIAAEKFRTNQAAAMIKAVVIVETESNPELRAFVSVIQEKDRGHTYTHMFHAMETPTLRSQVIENARKELIVWEKTYRDLHEFAMVHEAINSSVMVRG